MLVTIFSGRRSVRLFGQQLGRVRRARPQASSRATTFNVRTPLPFALGDALGARGRPGQRTAPAVIRPITLVP